MEFISQRPGWGRISSSAALSAALAVALLAGAPAMHAQGGGSGEHWVGTWATAVMAPRQAPQGQQQAQQNQAPRPVTAFNNQTLRQTVRVSIGGDRARVVFSNAFGTGPLAIGAARVALRQSASAIVPKSDRALTFGGRPSTIIPPGALIVSDPVSMTIPDLGDLVIDLYLPEDTASTAMVTTMHATGLQTNYISQPGNHTGAADLAGAGTTQSYFFLSRVEVMAPQSVGALVAFGDSITDGTRSTPDTNNRWPNHFAKRLIAQNRMGVMNLGISGNRVLSDGAGVSALARFDRDVLAQPGVTHVVVLEAINDVGGARENPSPTAEDLIVAHQQLAARAHAQGLKIFVSTLTPFEGAGYFTEVGEAKRQAFNKWVRSQNVYDGVIDFDAVTRDPQSPTKFLPKYDAGDHLHPSDAGYEAMANAIDLALFKAGTMTTAATR